LLIAFAHSNEPVDIWNIEKEDSEKSKEQLNGDTNDNQNFESLLDVNKFNIKIDSNKIEKKEKIVGLYDPFENGLSLNMWSKSDPGNVLKLSKKLNQMNLSSDAKKIYTKVLLTNTYSPPNPVDEKVFFDIKSDWLIQNGDIELIKNYVKKNIDIIPNEKLIKFVLNELLAENKNKQACQILEEIKINFKDNYLKNFSIYCLIYKKKKEEALLIFDLEKEAGYEDIFFEKKFQYLMGFVNNETNSSEKDLLSLHLSFFSNKNFKYVPSEKTPKLYWRYLSSRNLLDSLSEINAEDEDRIALIEIATNDLNYDEKDLFNLYKKFQFSIDQLVDVENEYEKLSSVKSRALLYQGILLSNESNRVVKLSKLLKESFIKDKISNAFNNQLQEILKSHNLDDLSSDLTDFYLANTQNKDPDKIIYNNKILHQSKLVNYFIDEKVSKIKVQKDLNNFLKKIKKSKKNLLITKDIILIEAMESDGIKIDEDLRYLYSTTNSAMPTDIQILINDKEIGMATLRLIEIIGQDNVKDLGSETIYFIINALNQMNIDPIRNEILYSILPLRA